MVTQTSIPATQSFHTVCIVKDYIRERDRRGREMFVPLTHPPGHAQADFGEATVIIGGVEQKAHFFAFDLPHSDACYIMAYPAATSEAWVDGHVHAFAFLRARAGVGALRQRPLPGGQHPAGRPHANGPNCSAGSCHIT